MEQHHKRARRQREKRQTEIKAKGRGQRAERKTTEDTKGHEGKMRKPLDHADISLKLRAMRSSYTEELLRKI